MTLSLAFHMIFAAAGIGLPQLLVVVEGLWLRTGRPHYRSLARKKATGILFAVGAVPGTALAFELGLLWPRFMELTGVVVGHVFGLEGYAFFLEAIFIGLYLYGWDRLGPRALVVRGRDRPQRGAAGARVRLARCKQVLPAAGRPARLAGAGVRTRLLRGVRLGRLRAPLSTEPGLRRGRDRPAAAGVGLAQQPYLVYPDIPLQRAAAPAATIAFMLATLPFGALLLIPLLWLLFYVFTPPTNSS